MLDGVFCTVKRNYFKFSDIVLGYVTVYESFKFFVSDGFKSRFHVAMFLSSNVAPSYDIFETVMLDEPETGRLSKISIFTLVDLLFLTEMFHVAVCL